MNAAIQIAVRFPVPSWFVQTVINDCGGDVELAEQWLEACSLSGRYIQPGSLKVLRLDLIEGGWKR